MAGGIEEQRNGSGAEGQLEDLGGKSEYTPVDLAANRSYFGENGGVIDGLHIGRQTDALPDDLVLIGNDALGEIEVG